MFYDQQEFDIRCEWGLRGATVLAPLSDVLIIVDVLSFSTCVDIAVERGATVFPYHWGVEGAAEYAASLKAMLANPKREKGKYSLSPELLLHLQPGEKIVIPSPNGAALALTAKPTPVLAGCLRNARSAAMAAMRYGTRIAVIPAGERWKDDQSLRPALEDLVGAGAIISQLRGRLSPEACAALAAFEAAKSQLAELLEQCSSGKELIGRGFPADVQLASQLDVSESAPTLVEDAFVAAQTAK